MIFFAELKRRNVFRVAITYGVFGWLILQVADTLGPVMGLPEATSRIVFFVVMLGFIPALVFSWAYELTPEGIKREKDVQRDSSITSVTGRRLNFITLGAVVALVAFTLVDRWMPATQRGPAAQAEADSELMPESDVLLPSVVPDDGNQSIAVLPFKDFSQAQDNEYFADGLSDTLLHMLAQVGDLRVAARTSSFSFKNVDEDIRSIGQKLDVDTILEGSVQKSGSTLRVIAQLIDVADGGHLWSETFDRPDSDIFAIQDEIANAVVQALKITVLGDVADFSAPATENLKAYDFYVLGRYHIDKRTKADLEQALNYFQKAADADPDYALAYVGLADSTMLLEDAGSTYGDLPRAEVIARAGPAIDRALALDPGLAEAYASRGLLVGRDDVEAAIESLAKALELNPNYAIAYMWYGQYLAEVGRVREADEAYLMALKLDPLSPVVATNAAYRFTIHGELERAETEYSRLRDLYPEQAFGLRNSLRHHLAWGNLDRAALYDLEAFRLAPSSAAYRFWMGLVYLTLDDPAAAEPWLDSRRTRGYFLAATRRWDELVEYETEYLASAPNKANTYGRLGIAEMNRGNLTDAARFFEQSEQAAGSRFDYFFDAETLVDAGELPAVNRADLWRRLGNTQRSNQDLAFSNELIQSMRDQGVALPSLDYVAAEVEAVKGNPERALELLRIAVEKGFRFAVLMESNLNLETLRDLPEYEQLLSDVRKILAEQRKRLEDNPNFVWGATPETALRL